MEPIATQMHASAAYVEQVEAMARLAGLRPDPTAGVALLVSDRLDPAATDSWLVASLPHLLVSIEAAQIRVGPFVKPGVTACLRCLLAGFERDLTEREPRVVDFADPEADPAILLVALGWAARDLARWHAGKLPITWSASITLDADLHPEARTELRRWPRHPHCGCCWGMAI